MGCAFSELQSSFSASHAEKEFYTNAGILKARDSHPAAEPVYGVDSEVINATEARSVTLACTGAAARATCLQVKKLAGLLFFRL